MVRLTGGPGGPARGAVVRPAPGVEASEFPVRAGVVVNATGVWADAVRALDEGGHPNSIRPAKGVHVTVPADRLPCDIAAVIPVPKDRRSIFVVSWPGTDLVYLGTTDTDYTGPLDDPACTPEDVDYLLDAANAVTTSRLTRTDVTGVWAGLRPLLVPTVKGGQSERTADLSRRHTVMTSRDGVVTVTGGKLTTYRKMAQDTVDAAVRVLGESPRQRRCVTRSLRLLGATTRTRDPVAQAQPQARLLGRYGTEMAAVETLADERPELREPARRGPPLHRRRAALRGTGGDGPDPRRRAEPPDPGADSTGARDHGGGAGGGGAPRAGDGLGRAHRGRPGGPLRRVLPEGAPDGGARPAVTAPTPVTPVDPTPEGVTDRLGGSVVDVPAALADRIARTGAAVSTDDAVLSDAARDWWPIAIDWAAAGAVPRRPAVGRAPGVHRAGGRGPRGVQRGMQCR